MQARPLNLIMIRLNITFMAGNALKGASRLSIYPMQGLPVLHGWAKLILGGGNLASVPGREKVVPKPDEILSLLPPRAVSPWCSMRK